MDPALPKLSEAEFTRQVLAFAKLCGWRVAHFRPARTAGGWRTAMSGDVGWPDLFLARPGKVLAVELKVGRNGLTADQEAWRDALAAAGLTFYVWRPADWPDIERVLT